MFTGTSPRRQPRTPQITIFIPHNNLTGILTAACMYASVPVDVWRWRGTCRHGEMLSMSLNLPTGKRACSSRGKSEGDDLDHSFPIKFIS